MSSPKTRSSLTLLALVFAVDGCQIIGDFASISGGDGVHDAGDSGAGGSEREAGAGGLGTGGSPSGGLGGGGASQCAQVNAPGVHSRGPEMVHLTEGQKCLWIDKTEVTRAQYTSFLQSSFKPSGGVCDFDKSLVPDSACLGTDGGLQEDDLPVTCVDWCDASAFCEWAGKRLCDGDYTKSTSVDGRGEWNFACSTDGKDLYPYGATYNAVRCNGKDNPTTGCASGSCALWPAGSSTTCATRAGVEDMTGNAAEWTGECQSVAGATDACNTFGGDINTADPQCSSKVSRLRAYTHSLLGFRCCAGESSGQSGAGGGAPSGPGEPHSAMTF